MHMFTVHVYICVYNTCTKINIQGLNLSTVNMKMCEVTFLDVTLHAEPVTCFTSLHVAVDSIFENL